MNRISRQSQRKLPLAERDAEAAVKRVDAFMDHICKVVGIARIKAKGLRAVILGSHKPKELMALVNALQQALVHALLGEELPVFDLTPATAAKRKKSCNSTSPSQTRKKKS